MECKELASKASQLGDWGGGGKELVRIFVKSHLIMCTAREHTILVVNRILNIKGLFLHCNQ